MFYHRFFCIFCLSLFLTACDADKLNGFAARLNKNVEEKVEYLTSSSSDNSKLSSARAKPNLSTLEETSNSLKELNETYKESKEAVKETKASIKEGVSEVKQSAKNVARKIPRSEKEANKMLIAFGDKYFGNWRAKFQKFGERLRQSRNGTGPSKSSGNTTSPNRLR